MYTLATKFKGRSYLIKWDAKDENFNPIDTTTPHNGPSCILNINKNGNNIAVGTNDGNVALVDANTMSVYRRDKKHKMPILSIMFTEDASNVLTVSSDNTYEITPNTSKSSLYQKFVKLCMMCLFLTALYVVVTKYLI